MGDLHVQVPPDSTGPKLRTYRRGAAAGDVHDQYVIPTVDRIITNTGICPTFRTPGRASTTQPIFSLANANGSSILVALRRVVMQLDATAVLTAVMPVVRLYRCASTTLANGTVLTKGQFNAGDTPSASVEVRGDASADGTGSGTVLSSSAFGTAMWQQYAMRMHTAVGQVLAPDNPMIPALADQTPIILRANEAVIIRVDAAATTSNPTTNHWFVQAVWEEYTRP